MPQTKFRSLPLRESPARVDRENRVIYGVSAAQAVEALGHGFMLDGKTIEQIVTLGNKAKSGVKSRFTHPGLSSDGMGKHLGRMKNFRAEGDKAIADLHLSNAASKAPDGDLASYVMDLAEEDAAAFGMSVVLDVDAVWTFADGHEEAVSEEWQNGGDAPKGTLTKLPVVRAMAFAAVDVVDEPAANRDGMFSQALWGTNVLGEEMFGEFDGLLAQVGMTPERAWDYALKYFDARGVKLKGIKMAEESAVEVTEQDDEIVAAVEIENEGEEEVTQEEVKELRAQMDALQAEKLAEQAKAAQLAETVATMQKEARSARFQKLATGWQGEIAAHLTVLEALGEGSEAYGVYCQQQKALSAQIEQGDLFKEKGRNAPVTGASAGEQLAAKANEIVAGEKVKFSEAMVFAAERNPALYAEYVEEVRGK